MAAQRKEMVVSQNFIYTPSTLEEAEKYALKIASSGLCPEAVRGKPNDVFIILQTGAELGLKPMQSLRTLGVINGMPFAYGDGALALARRHPDFMDIEEWFEGKIEDKSIVAYCKITRRDQTPVIRMYSVEDAVRAGLWGKTHKNGLPSTWVLHAKRMLQHRARGLALHDCFPDALYGLPTEQEAYSIIAMDEAQEAPKVKTKGMSGLEDALGIQDEEVSDAEFTVSTPSKLDALKELIESRKVTKGSITVTLKKCGVASLEELSDDQIDTWSTHLKSKESK